MNKSALMLEINIPAPGLRPGAGFLHAYTESLLKEIENCSEDLAEYDIRSVYVRGAGGPNDLDLRVLTRTLKNSFDIAGAERVIEIAANRISTADMSTWQNFRTNLYRINLASLNYPDFNRLRLPYEYTHYTWIQKLLSYSSMTNVCIELLLGIPGQTPPSITDSLNRVMDFNPDKVCFIPFTREAFEQLRTRTDYDTLMNGNAKKADAEELLGTADVYLTKRGYHRTSVYEYAKPGMDSTHTVLQCTDCEYWGLGVGAVSFIDGCILTNTYDPDLYISAGGDAEKIISGVVRLDEASLMKNAAFRGLYAADGIRLDEFEAKYGTGLCEAFEKMKDGGLAAESDGRIALTTAGAADMSSVRKLIS